MSKGVKPNPGTVCIEITEPKPPTSMQVVVLADGSAHTPVGTMEPFEVPGQGWFYRDITSKAVWVFLDDGTWHDLTNGRSGTWAPC